MSSDKAQQFRLVSDKPIKEWQSALVELLEELSSHQVKGIVVGAITQSEEPDGNGVEVFYRQMSLRERLNVADTIQADVMLELADHAIRRYMGDTEGDNEKDDE